LLVLSSILIPQAQRQIRPEIQFLLIVGAIR
jgi:hypothetical protein